MIANIDIENFRCFEKTNIEGFKRINLITGKNNVGKTALLEAIYFLIDRTQNFPITRTDETNERKNNFFNSNTQNEITISSINSDLNRIILIHKFNNMNNNRSLPVLQSYQIKLIFDKNHQFPQLPNLAAAFDKLEINGFGKIILEAIQKIDTSIAEIRTFSNYPRVLFLRKINEEKYQPINYFGDAIQKIARYVVNILELKTSLKSNKILLVDEIENGLHYAAQEEFWQMLFTLCIDYDIQLFATTHSLEMIRAFEKIASKYEDEAAYFEMARHPKTNRIIGLKHDIEALGYALETDTKIRGEV